MSFSFISKIKTEEVCRQRRKSIDLLKYANANRVSFYDVDISTGNKNIPANKMLLSCASKYFQKLFKTEMKEKYEKSVKVESVDWKSMNSLIEFIYSGSINITSQNVVDLLSASDYLMVEEVKEFCFEFLQEAVSPDSCCAVQSIASRYQNTTLENHVQKFFFDNFAEVVSSADFEHLSKDELMGFLIKQEQTREDLVYKAIVAWTKYDKSNRGRDFPQLFAVLKFNTIHLSFLKNVVSKEDLVKNDHSCCRIVMEALCSPRNTSLSQYGYRIVSIGGEKTQRKVLDVFSLKEGKEGKILPDLSESVSYGNVVEFDNFVFSVEGKKRSLWKLNLNEEVLGWKKLASLNSSRQYFGCAFFNDIIVASGGLGTENLSTCESYSPVWNNWITGNIDDLNFYRNRHVLVSCKGYLFAIGGQSYSSLSSVECYKPEQGRWTNVQPMQIPRYLLAAVHCNDMIYAIGGSNGSSLSLKSCERYDIQKNKWMFISNMNFNRKECSACVLQGKIYVVGGRDNKDEAVKEIECYDPSTYQWNIVGRTDDELYGHSLVVL